MPAAMLHSRLLTVAMAVAALATIGSSHELNATSPACRYLQSDPEWPGHTTWQALNSSVEGRLIASVPLASPCHDPHFNEADCAALAQAWPYPQTHFNSSSSIITPYFQNESCSPFQPEAQPCTLGNLISYAIDVKTAQDAAAGLAFCKANNIRAVIKNTGHDFLGRSTGASGLGLWTHHLKSIQYIDYQSQHYNGSAMKFGSGVQAWEAYEAAYSYGVRIIGATCPTVAIAGGYTQGGGHGMLSSVDGLSADNVLEWELVTANGSHVVATPVQHPELFWALCGGGAGNLGVVISMTQRVFKDGIMGGASFLMTSEGVSQDLYWDAIGSWHASIPDIVANGGTTGYLVNNEIFEVQHVTFPNRSEAEVRSILQPFVNALAARNLTFQMNVTSLPNFLDHTTKYIGLPYGDDSSNQVTGSRLVPQSVIQRNNTALTSTLRRICSDLRFTILGVGLNVSKEAAIPNAVLPAWRETNLHLIVSGYWNYSQPFASNLQTQQALTDVQIPRLESLTPGSGSYMNEGNFQQPNWQKTFYGANHARLQDIKRKYDPTGLFYVTKGVGSEAWTAEADGRLCHTSQ